ARGWRTGPHAVGAPAASGCEAPARAAVAAQAMDAPESARGRGAARRVAARPQLRAPVAGAAPRGASRHVGSGPRILQPSLRPSCGTGPREGPPACSRAYRLAFERTSFASCLYACAATPSGSYFRTDIPFTGASAKRTVLR